VGKCGGSINCRLYEESFSLQSNDNFIVPSLDAMIVIRGLELSLFGTYGSYFFGQAGIKDPFKITAITSSIQIASVICTVLAADLVGRRRIACCATTLCWVSDVAIGIIGVVPQHQASIPIFLVFACLWSMLSCCHKLQYF
jgi:hypothetical protein